MVRDVGQSDESDASDASDRPTKNHLPSLRLRSNAHLRLSIHLPSLRLRLRASAYSTVEVRFPTSASFSSSGISSIFLRLASMLRR